MNTRCSRFYWHVWPRFNFLQTIVSKPLLPVQSGDETANNGMVLTSFPSPQKSHLWKINIKTFLITFFYSKNMIHQEFVLQVQTVSAEFYETVLRRFLLQIRCVRRWMYRSGKWSLLHENACPLSATRVRNSLAWNRVTVILHSPYSLDLVPAHFFMFLVSKESTRHTFCWDASHHMTRDIYASIDPKRNFADLFQQLYQRRQKCIVVIGC